MSRGQKGQLGTQTHAVRTPARKKRDRERRKREEAAWKAKCGPVTVRYIDPD
jgi:hypothetical protein